MDAEKGLWHCHGCQKGGDVIQFIRGIQQCGFREAVDTLADVNDEIRHLMAALGR